MTSARIPSKFSSHSFRIGAATVAAHSGIPDHLIQTMGRWSSNASQLYIRMPADSLAALSKKLASASHMASGRPHQLAALIMALGSLSLHGSCLSVLVQSGPQLIPVRGLARYILWFSFLSFFVELGERWCLGYCSRGSEVPGHPVIRSLCSPSTRRRVSLGGSRFQGCHGYLLSACCIWPPTNPSGTSSQAHHQRRV